jgi:hypothetical protein
VESNNSQQNDKINSKEQSLQNNKDNLHTKRNVSAQKDGFRYDYNDSSDFK